MADREPSLSAEQPSSDADFHRWLAERNRHRAARLGWTLVVVLLSALALTSFLALQLTEVKEGYDAVREDVRRLNRRIDTAAEPPAVDRQARRETQCLEAEIAKAAKGLQRLLKREITTTRYLRVYGAPPRCG